MNSTTNRVLNFIISYKTEHDGNSPTLSQICAATDTRSKNTVWEHLVALEEAGIITRPFGTARHIGVIGGKWIPPLTMSAHCVRKAARAEGFKTP